MWPAVAKKCSSQVQKIASCKRNLGKADRQSAFWRPRSRWC